MTVTCSASSNRRWIDECWVIVDFYSKNQPNRSIRHKLHRAIDSLIVSSIRLHSPLDLCSPIKTLSTTATLNPTFMRLVFLMPAAHNQLSPIYAEFELQCFVSFFFFTAFFVPSFNCTSSPPISVCQNNIRQIVFYFAFFVNVLY